MRVPAGFHFQAARRGWPKLGNRPGLRGTGMQPMARVPVGAYTRRLSGLMLSGGQVQGLVPASGILTLSVGPQGLGTVWYPVQLTLSTTTGVFDPAVAKAWIGAQGVPVTLVGTVYSGNGTVSLAIPSMSPGQVLIITWTGAKTGDTAGCNVIGTQDALSTG